LIAVSARTRSARAPPQRSAARDAQRTHAAAAQRCSRRAAWRAFCGLIHSLHAAAQEAHRLRSLLYSLRPDLLTSKADAFEGAWPTLAGFKEEATQNWCARALVEPVRLR